METRKDGLAGATVDIKGKLVEYTWWLKKEGYAESTVRMRTRRLKRLLDLEANLFDPESVKLVISMQSSWCTTTKAVAVEVYSSFLRMLNVEWTPPRYKHTRTLPFIPTEAEIDSMISASGQKTATFLQVLKETAMRAGEACSLQWTDLDVEHNLINLRKPEKGSNPRIFRASKKLISMIGRLKRDSDRIFGAAGVNSMRTTFFKTRRRIAQKLGNSRLLRIHYHTLRHSKATMEYHKTGNIYHVKQLLGHKSIKNTEIYINLEQAIFGDEYNCEYSTRIAKTVKGARALLAAGFSYVTDMDGYKLFRRRK